ncbi:hypothetical protein ACHAXH_001372 [Discostella pseudostelligera]
MQPFRHPRVYEIESLKHITLAHGTFYFGPHSHQVEIDSTYEPVLNSMQQELLDDEVIDVQKEKERCERYNYELVDEANPRRRLLFLGSLLGDDSTEKWKYHDRENPLERLNTLYQLFAPKTKVSVEYYVSSLEGLFGRQSDLSLEYCQREGSAHRWALNVMRLYDIGIISDADEIFTRDFLRAMQICDVPEFRPNQDCMQPKVLASTIAMESSPNCVTKDRRWWHPDAILGECVEHVGNSSLHPPAKREYNDRHGLRGQGHGLDGNFTAYWSENSLEPDSGIYPTWTGADMRREAGGSQAKKVDGSPTGYHFHNFFTSSEAIHVKYHTYGHAAYDAMDKPLWELHDDIQLAVDCATGKSNEKLELLNNSSNELPIYYLNDVIRRRRHGAWQSIVAAEEEYWMSAQNKSGKEYNATKYLQS